jgi:hypothetical protein
LCFIVDDLKALSYIKTLYQKAGKLTFVLIGLHVFLAGGKVLANSQPFPAGRTPEGGRMFAS